MHILERLGFWKRVGTALNTTAGTRVMEFSRGLLNFSTRLLPGPGIDGPPPLTRLSKALPDSRIAVVTTSGLYQEDDRPFDVDNPRGDASFREFPSGISAGNLRIAHAHYTHRWWEEDPEVLLPLTLLHEAEEAGAFHLGPRFFSFGFAGLLKQEFLSPKTGTAQILAQHLIDDGVDIALMVPA